MNDRIPEPVQDLGRVVVRTLRILFAGFCLAPAGYLALYFILGGTRVSSSALGKGPEWDQWRFFFMAAGLASLYASYRVRMVRLDPERIVRWARARLAHQASAGKDSPLPRVLQDLVGRIALDHVILWALVEIPSILGVIDWLITGDSRYFFGLVGLSILGLLIHRPRASRVAAILESFWDERG